MESIPPTLPFHISKAYGVRAPGPQLQIRAVDGPPATDGAGRVIDRAAQARLVAARVPGGIDFRAETPQPRAAESLPMYRHPADRNAAATGVNVGRVIDVQG